MQSVEELLVQIVSKMDDNGFKKLDKLETQATKQTSILSKQLKNLFVGVLGNIGAKEIIDASVKMDTLNKSFAALAGSEIGGAEQIKYLRQETERLGQDFVTAADAYKNLFSAGVGTGMNPEEIQKIFSSVLEAGTVLGSSEQQMQGALMALEQMISKGKVSMEELRRQLGNALPGAMQIAARAMKTNSKGLQEMLEAGLDSKKFVTAFANQLHYEFGDKAVKASHTLRAELARLKNELFNVKTSFLDGDAGEAFADTIRQLVIVLKSPELQGSLKGISQFLTFALKHLKPIMAIIGFLVANMAIGKVGKGVATIFGLGRKGGKFVGQTVSALKYLTQGMKILPMISRIISLLAWMVGPIKAIQIVASVVMVIYSLVKARLKNVEDKKQKRLDEIKSRPELIDGKYYESNRNRSDFMRAIPQYSKQELYNMFHYGVPQDFKPVIIQKTPAQGSLTKYNTVSIQPGAIQINTRSSDPIETQYAVEAAMARVFDSVKIFL